MKHEVYPCPFCVSCNISLCYWGEEMKRHIRCNGCEASGPKCSTGETAVKVWNDITMYSTRCHEIRSRRPVNLAEIEK